MLIRICIFLLLWFAPPVYFRNLESNDGSNRGRLECRSVIDSSFTVSWCCLHNSIDWLIDWFDWSNEWMIHWFIVLIVRLIDCLQVSPKCPLRMPLWLLNTHCSFDPYVNHFLNSRSPGYPHVFFQEALSSTTRIWTSLVAGATAGALAKTTIAPLDRTKINFQSWFLLFPTILAKFYNFTFFFSSIAWQIYPEGGDEIFNGALQAWRLPQSLAREFRHHGARYSVRGDSVCITRAMEAFIASGGYPVNSFHMNIFHFHSNSRLIDWLIDWLIERRVDQLIDWLIDWPCLIPRRTRSPGKRFLAGSLAGVTASTLTYPLDLARARMAVTEKSRYNTLLDVFRHLLKEEGWLALYRGFSPTILGVIPYAGASFFTFETLKRKHLESTKRPARAYEKMLFGACT